MKKFAILFSFFLVLILGFSSCKNEKVKETPISLMGNRFLTFNCVIRVNQIEVSRDKNVGEDERNLHTPEKLIAFRDAIDKGFPGAKITWAFSWLALHDTRAEFSGWFMAPRGNAVAFRPRP